MYKPILGHINVLFREVRHYFPAGKTVIGCQRPESDSESETAPRPFKSTHHLFSFSLEREKYILSFEQSWKHRMGNYCLLYHVCLAKT